MSGNANQDLADFFKRGGITFIRDMLRADQFLSYPCAQNSQNTQPVSCTKTDALSSSCIEAIVPIAKLIVNGPPAIAADGTTSARRRRLRHPPPSGSTRIVAGCRHCTSPSPTSTPLVLGRLAGRHGGEQHALEHR